MSGAKTRRILQAELTLVAVMTWVAMLYFFNRGFNYYDEGHILHLAERILNGDIPYRDFHFIYTPGTLYATAAAFKFLGVSMLSGRILLLVTAIITSMLIYILARTASQSRLAGAIAACAYISWCPTHINFPWPVHFAILAACATTLACFMYDRRTQTRYLLLAGWGVFATLFFKHNFGAAAALIVAAYILPRPDRFKLSLPAVTGFLSGCIGYGVYLATTGSLAGFYHDMMYYTYQKILVEHMLWTPFIYGTGASAAIKTVFFLSPLLIVSLAWSLLYQKGKTSLKEMYLFAFPAAFYGLGIRPTTDFIHLAPLLSLSGIVLAILIARSRGITKMGGILIAAVVVLAGFYSALFRGYYRWETPLARQHVYISNPRVRLYVDEKYAAILSGMKDSLSRSGSRDALIYEYAPTFYVALGLHNPTAYDLLASSALSADVEASVIHDLERRRVSIVITDSPFAIRKATRITRFIQNNYVLKRALFEFGIWKHK